MVIQDDLAGAGDLIPALRESVDPPGFMTNQGDIAKASGPINGHHFLRPSGILGMEDHIPRGVEDLSGLGSASQGHGQID